MMYLNSLCQSKSPFFLLAQQDINNITSAPNQNTTKLCKLKCKKKGKLFIFPQRMLKTSILSLKRLFRNQCKQRIRRCTTGSMDKQDEKEKELERIAKNALIDQPPTTCCQSGCSSCVFIAWADALTAKMGKNPEIGDKILESVNDPSMKAFLEMELKFRGLKK